MTPLTTVDIILDATGDTTSDAAHRLDLSDLADHARLICPRSHAAKIKERLAEFRRLVAAPCLTRFGSGDFHHFSLMLLETLPCQRRPVTLILFDNHPDWFVLPPRYHCGNWVAGALGLPFIDRAVLIGQGGDDLCFVPMHFAPAADLASGRLTFHPLRVGSVRAPLTRVLSRSRCPRLGTDHRRLRFEAVEAVGLDTLVLRLAAELRGQAVYLSIDKDCLTTSAAATDWDQGGLGLDELARAVRVIAESVELVGADICGDRAATPLKGFFKRFDAGRLRARWVPPTPGEVELNARANRVLSAALGGHSGDARAPAASFAGSTLIGASINPGANA